MLYVLGTALTSLYNWNRTPIAFLVLLLTVFKGLSPDFSFSWQKGKEEVFASKDKSSWMKMNSCEIVSPSFKAPFLLQKKCRAQHPSVKKRRFTDTQTGMLLGFDSQERKLRSKFWWFTQFCNSHYVSHFAAFFIVTRTKISVAKSCLVVIFFNCVFLSKNTTF